MKAVYFGVHTIPLLILREREEEGLRRWEMSYLWQTQLLIIEFNLCFIPSVTFKDFWCLPVMLCPSGEQLSLHYLTLLNFGRITPRISLASMCFICCSIREINIHLFPFCSLLSHSVQKPSMQGVQISNDGQQVDAGAGTDGGVHSVVHHPQAAARALHSGGPEQVCGAEIPLLSF